MESWLIKNVQLVNEGSIEVADVYVEKEIIHTIGRNLRKIADHKIEGREAYLLPGLIDDQVHFREPGLTHKADIYTESRAAIAGGITSYMEMPNTHPASTTRTLLQQKFDRAAQTSFANYSFYIGATNHNLNELLAADPNTVCGIKIFMGSSTGDLLVDDSTALERIFAEAKMLIATHCEHEPTIRENLATYREKFGETGVRPEMHPAIRSHEACWLSSSFAIELAKKHNTRLHILHISTAQETELFTNTIPLSQKRITAEVCVHHLWFSDADYAQSGNLIKWNPAIKTAQDRAALWDALLDDRLDVIATDHAPHTLIEKQAPYFSAPSGGPLVQHSLLALLECSLQGKISMPKIVEKACHAPAALFQIERRGYLREGYFADLVLVQPALAYTVSPTNILYKCGWSPFNGQTFQHTIQNVWVNGQLTYQTPNHFYLGNAKPLRFLR